MHESSLCQSLVRTLSALARQHGAVAVARVEVQVGVLCGVAAQWLVGAVTIAKRVAVANGAARVTQVVAPRVSCRRCTADSDTPPNQLSCPACGSPETELLRAQALMLTGVERVRGDALAAV